ncbi:Protein Y79H2A.3 b, partial [Aphelenchoides avenae]
MMPRRELWDGNKCILCHTQYFTEQDKCRHEDEDAHRQKAAAYDFLCNDLPSHSPVKDKRSVLLERYYRASAPVAGLECICELNFADSKLPLWICTICNVAGRRVDSADAHLYSSSHRRKYLEEYHPQRYADVVNAQKKAEPQKQLSMEYNVILNVLLENAELSPPEVYVIEDRDTAWAVDRLGLSGAEEKDAYIAESVSDLHELVMCQTCGETFMVYEKAELKQKAWQAHISTQNHQRALIVSCIAAEGRVEEREELPSDFHANYNNEFRVATDGIFYGPTVGMEHMLRFKDGTALCKVCHCVVQKNTGADHFSSELHIVRYLRRHFPSQLLNLEHLDVNERQRMLSDLLKRQRPTQRHSCATAKMPTLLSDIAFPEQRRFSESRVREQIIRGRKFRWCTGCNENVELMDKDSWKEHIFDERHFDWIAKKALFNLDQQGFVSEAAQLPVTIERKQDTSGWEQSPNGRDLLQNHCDFYGAEWIVKDSLAHQLICRCCFVCVSESKAEL